MPDHPRQDRLSHEELLLLQRKALREWQESDWLAANRPEAWQALQDDGVVRVDLGSGIGESQQEPGYIALDKDMMSRTELRERSGECRNPDLQWDLHNGLPFEDSSVVHRKRSQEGIRRHFSRYHGHLHPLEGRGNLCAEMWPADVGRYCGQLVASCHDAAGRCGESSASLTGYCSAPNCASVRSRTNRRCRETEHRFVTLMLGR